MTYQLLIEEKALEYLRSLPEKSMRLVADRCLSLADDPFPGSGSGDREALHLPGFKKLYRLHVGRCYTVFYRIYEDEKVVTILAITTIEKPHKMYGRL